MTRQAQHTCSGCGNAAPLRCTACQRVYYCSQECQRRHWSTHKLDCKQHASDKQNTLADRACGSTPAKQGKLHYPVPPACPKPDCSSGTILVRRTSGRRLHAALQAAAAINNIKAQAPCSLADDNQTPKPHIQVQPPPSSSLRLLEGIPSQKDQLNNSLGKSIPVQTTCTGSANESIDKPLLIPKPPPGRPSRFPVPSNDGLSNSPATSQPLAKPWSCPTPFLRPGFLVAQQQTVAEHVARERGSVSAPTLKAGNGQAATIPDVTSWDGSCKTNSDTVFELPHDVMSLILGLLPARSLAVAMQVCKDCCQLCKQPHLWARHVTELGVALPEHWLKQGHSTPGHTPSNLQDDSVHNVRLSPTPPPSVPTKTSQNKHLVVGIQSIRALRAAALTSRPAEQSLAAVCLPTVSNYQTNVFLKPCDRRMNGTANPAGQPPELHTAVAAALKQRANWHHGRYAEYRLHDHTAAIECLAFTQTQLWGATLVTAGWDGTVHVYAMYAPTSRAQQQQLTPQPSATPLRLQQHVSDSILGSQVRDDCLLAQPARKNSHPSNLPPPELRKELKSHIIASTPVILGTGSTDKRVNMWAYDNAGTLPTSVATHPAGVAAVKFAYSGCETMAVTGCTDGSVHLWDMLTKQKLRSFIGHTDAVWGLHRLPGYGLVTSSRDGTLRMWQLPTLQKKHVMDTSPHSRYIFPISTTPSRENVQSAQPTTTPSQTECIQPSTVQEAIKWMDVVETRTVIQACMQSGRCYEVLCLQSGHASPVADLNKAVCMSLSRCSKSNFRLQPNSNDTASDDEVNAMHELPAHTPVVLCMDVYMHIDTAYQLKQSYSPVAADAESLATDKTGRVLVATGGADGLVQVWDATNFTSETVVPKLTLQGHVKGVLSVKFGWLPESVNERAGCQPQVSTGANNPAIARMTHTVAQGMHDSAKQRLVLLSGSVGEVKVWDPFSATCLQTLKDHTGPVTSILVSHNHVVTMAMNDGLYVYAARCTYDADSLSGRQNVLVPVNSLLDGTGLQYRFGAALAVCPQALVVGSSTGECIILDYGCLLTMQL